MTTTNSNAPDAGGDNSSVQDSGSGTTPYNDVTGEIPVVDDDNVTRYIRSQESPETVSSPVQMPPEPVYDMGDDGEYDTEYYPEEEPDKKSTTGYKIAIAVLSAGLVLVGALAFRAWADDNNAVSKGMESSEEINGLNKNLDELTADYEELTVERDGLNFRIDDLNKQIDKLNGEKDSLSRDLEEANKQKDEAQKRADEAREEVGRLRSELENARNSGSTTTNRGSNRSSGVPVPSLVGMTVDEAVSALDRAGFSTVQINGSGNRVVSQTPSAGTSISRTDSVTITAQ